MTPAKENLIANVKGEIGQLSKDNALSLAASLADNIEANYFKLGGVLCVIKENGWWNTQKNLTGTAYESFDAYISGRFKFRPAKASYLINIYKHLVNKQIPWEKVQHLGWTKLRLIASIVTLENLDEWVAKAGSVTYAELCEVVKAKPDASGNAKTTDEQVTMKFKLHKDQVEVVQHALAKAKGELQTEYDSVALENVMALYLNGNAGSAVPAGDLKSTIAGAGWEAVLMAFGEMFPEIDLAVTLPNSGNETEAAA